MHSAKKFPFFHGERHPLWAINISTQGRSIQARLRQMPFTWRLLAVCDFKMRFFVRRSRKYQLSHHLSQAPQHAPRRLHWRANLSDSDLRLPWRVRQRNWRLRHPFGISNVLEILDGLQRGDSFIGGGAESRAVVLRELWCRALARHHFYFQQQQVLVNLTDCEKPYTWLTWV